MHQFVALLSRLFQKHDQDSQIQRKRRYRRAFSYHSLEARQLLASISFNAGTGVLTLTGDAGVDDSASVEVTAPGTITARLAGQADQSLNSADVTSIMFIGNSGNDFFRNSTAITSTAIGGEGNDRLVGGSGNDTLIGNAGSDRLLGGAGNDQLSGLAGNDFLFGQAGEDNILGGDDNDYIDGGSENDTILAGLGNDTALGRGGNDQIFGQEGNDLLLGNEGDDQLWGFSGNDDLRGNDGNDLLYGASGNDRLNGGNDADVIRGGDGNDLAYGGDGNDQLFGQLGHDTLAGQGGNDLIRGGGVANGALPTPAPGNELLPPPAGFGNRLFGNDGNDTIIGGDAHDFILGGAGNDILSGLAGTDYIAAGGGDDQARGGDDADIIFGGNGNDQLLGEGGMDQLFGGGGQDGLFGGVTSGDLLNGGGGPDRLLYFTSDTIQGLKPEDARIDFRNGTDQWTDGEVEAVDNGLANLHHEVMNTNLLKGPETTMPYVFIKQLALPPSPRLGLSEAVEVTENVLNPVTNQIETTTYVENRIFFGDFDENNATQSALVTAEVPREIAHFWASNVSDCGCDS